MYYILDNINKNWIFINQLLNKNKRLLNNWRYRVLHNKIITKLGRDFIFIISDEQNWFLNGKNQNN